jgi:hypothetical protein
MKRICAWCGKALDDMDSPATPHVTHGLCEGCRQAVFSSTKSSGQSTGMAIAEDIVAQANSSPQE